MTKPSIPTSDLIDMTAIEAEWRPQSAGKIRAHFFDCDNGMARLIAEKAVCVKLLKERGDSLAGIHYVGMWLKVAECRAVPELIATFIESPNRRRVEGLSVPDQKKIAANPMYPIIEEAKGGGYTDRPVDLRTATREQIALAISPDGVLRSKAEQVAVATSAKACPLPKRKPVEDEDIGDRTEPLDKTLTIKLTATELEAVKIRAAISHKKEWEVIRRFLYQTDAFKRPKT